MDSVFIGWSGNKELAEALAALINSNTKKRAIVGGGSPRDMFVGAQVLGQIDKCNLAILLVQDKEEDGRISPNLLFEWGYIMARFSIDHIHSFLLNKASKDLPSDLMGTWVSEVSFDEEDTSTLAQRIFDIFIKNTEEEKENNYFDLISDWKHVFAYLTDSRPKSDQEICEFILMGCLAAYYYTDYRELLSALGTITGSDAVNKVVYFAKSYVDIFLKTENMTNPLPQEDFFVKMQDFDAFFQRKRSFCENLETILDILCNDIYGLACSLFLKTSGLDDETALFIAQRAEELLKKGIELLDAFEEKSPVNECLVQLLRSYLYNDLAHLYQGVLKDSDAFIHYLSRSVNERKSLHQTFSTLYPKNTFLANKLEQEYIVALSEQCNYMDKNFFRKMSVDLVISKFKNWERDLIYTSSLTDRIKRNIEKFSD